MIGMPEPITYVAGWTLYNISECDSSNDFARDMGSWTAVSTKSQRRGRGRHGRVWQSDEGGLWMSAVAPAPIDQNRSKLMPLAAGWAVASTLSQYGCPNVHLRWPNDVMVDGKKCAGILVDRFHPDRCVIGMGVNVWNDPSAHAPELGGTATRLADILGDSIEPYQVSVEILANLRQILLILDQEGAKGLMERLRPFWKSSSRVAVRRGTQETEYEFLGVDDEGRVLLKSKTGLIQPYAPEDIEMLREI